MGKTSRDRRDRSKSHKKDMKHSSRRSRSGDRKKHKRDDSYERRRRKREDIKKHKKRYSSSESDSDHRRRDKKHQRKHRRSDSRDGSRTEESKRQARLAKARMLSLLQEPGMDLDEDEKPVEIQDFTADEEKRLKEQLRLFEESGIEGKKVVLTKEGETKPEDIENIDKSKSELPQPDGSKINDNISGDNQNEESSIVSNQSKEDNRRVQKSSGFKEMTETSSNISQNEPNQLPKNTFVSLESVDNPAKQSTAPKPNILPSINLNKPQVNPNSKVINVFNRTPEQSPRKSFEPVKSENNSVADEDSEDPLDAFMKTIKGDAAVQDDLGMDKGEDKAIDNVISFDEIANLNNDYSESAVDNSNMDSDEDDMQMDTGRNKVADDDQYYKDFISKLRKERATDDQERFFNDEDAYLDEIANSKASNNDDFLEKQKKATEKREMLLSSKLMQSDCQDTFQKNFYIEPKEISDMNDEEVEQYRKDLGDVAVRGIQCPKPIKSWFHCGLNQRIMAVLKKKEFEGPRPIQAQAIPAIMGGRDVIGIAETGSGKTLAYLLPMLRHILNQRALKEGDGMIGLIMAPTRELAQQIYNEARAFTRVLNLNIVCVYGGAEVGSQLSQLKRTVEIVVCTPGRMIDVLTTNGGKFTNLHRVTYMVLDEADRMLDMGFEPQISRIIGGTRDDRQTVMFSATFPKTIVSLAKRILKTPLEVVVGNRGAACRSIEQFVKIVDEDSKLLLLTNLLDEWIGEGSILIFVDTQKEADELFRQLFELKYDLFVLHGAIDHTDREFTLQDFKKGVRKIMVATSIAARGLDIKSIRVVINYKCPDHMEDYIHRIGRTGRAGNQGTAYTFITRDEEHLAKDLLTALKASDQPIEPELIELDGEYMRKIREGEIDRKKKYTVISGRGFDFSEEERKKFADTKKNHEKGMYQEDAEDVSDSEINIKNANDKQNEVIQLSEHRLNEILRDPKAKQIAKEASLKATKEALIQGLEPDKIVELADKAIIEALAEYKPQSRFEKGMEQAMKIRDSFTSRENEQNNHFTAELEINDYPQPARQKVCSRDFLSSIYDLAGCQVSVRGSFIEPGKSIPLGQRKQHLFVEGSSKHEVANAYKELKRVLEENAANSAMNGMNQSSGRYSVV